MSFSALSAINAYAQAAQTAKTGEAGAAIAGLQDQASSGTDFSAMVKEAIGSATTGSIKAENISITAASGQGELIDVVTAISEATIQLETVIAVRDEMIKAYQDILRMPI